MKNSTDIAKSITIGTNIEIKDTRDNWNHYEVIEEYEETPFRPHTFELRDDFGHTSMYDFDEMVNCFHHFTARIR